MRSLVGDASLDLGELTIVASARQGPVVIAEGEATGHHRRLLGSVTMYRDEAMARDIPPGLYVAHVTVESPTARLVHEEHAPIALDQATYRARRQRQLEPTGFGERFAVLQD